MPAGTIAPAVFALMPTSAVLNEAIEQLETAGFDRADLSLPEIVPPPERATPEAGAKEPDTGVEAQQSRVMHSGLGGAIGAMMAATDCRHWRCGGGYRGSGNRRRADRRRYRPRDQPRRQRGGAGGPRPKGGRRQAGAVGTGAERRAAGARGRGAACRGGEPPLVISARRRICRRSEGSVCRTPCFGGQGASPATRFASARHGYGCGGGRAPRSPVLPRRRPGTH